MPPSLSTSSTSGCGPAKTIRPPQRERLLAFETSRRMPTEARNDTREKSTMICAGRVVVSEAKSTSIDCVPEAGFGLADRKAVHASVEDDFLHAVRKIFGGQFHQARLLAPRREQQFMLLESIPSNTTFASLEDGESGLRRDPSS